MEAFSALLALCARNSPVTGEFPSQRPVTRSLDVFFDLRLNKRLSKHSWGWWFVTPSRSLWRHCNAYVLFQVYEGGDNTGTLLLNGTDADLITQIQTTQDVYIKFVSDAAFTALGFALRYSIGKCRMQTFILLSLKCRKLCKYAYELLILWTLKNSPLYKMHIFNVHHGLF